MASTGIALAHRFTDGTYGEGLSDVLRGLQYIPRQLSHTWLYDERGCRLFEKIRELPEYYLTRTEIAIMQTRAREMAELLGDEDLVIVEYGSGDSAKLHSLLEVLPRLRAYVPIDIAASSLARARHALGHDHPHLTVLPLCADFTRPLELPAQLPVQTRRLIYFAGSTLGNYEQHEARRLLSSMRELAGSGGAALIGIDLCKERGLLERAYDDSLGVTAEFNLNALRHVNRRLGIGFDISHFRHRAAWVEAEQRIEMQLVSTVNQTVRAGAALMRLQRGDFIRTECCHKYTPPSFQRLAEQAGWAVRACWSDAAQWFSVQLLVPR